MPTYCYLRPGGDVVERFYQSFYLAPKTIRCKDGVRAKMAAVHPTDASMQRRFVGGKSPWPMKSRGAAVRPDQVESMERLYPGHEFDKITGEAIFRSASHRRKCLRDRSFVDLDDYRSGKNV